MMRTSLPGLLLVLVLTVPAVGSAGTLPRTEPEAETGADPALSAVRAFLATAGALPGSDARAAPLLDAASAALELAEGSDTRPAAWPEVLRAALRLRAGMGAGGPLGPTFQAGLPLSEGVVALEKAAVLASRGGTGLREPLLLALEVGAPEGPAPPLPVPEAFAHAAEALAALAERRGVALGASDLEALDDLGSRAPDVDAALARIVALHMAHAEATRQALVDGSADLPRLLAARRALVEGVLEALPGLRRVDQPPIVECRLVDLDLRGVDSLHACDVLLSIDVGGHDLYTNNGGGADFNAGTQAALAIDLAGDDTYRAQRAASSGLFGGAFLGAGALLDMGGNDLYDGRVGLIGGVTGGGTNGAGFLLDAGGDDSYTGHVGPSGGVNGGAQLGAGLLFDGGGRDTYQGVVGVSGGANGGAGPLGLGVLVDLGGDDAYTGTGLTAGVNGGSQSAGQGLLLDAAGDDAYRGTVTAFGGANGGAEALGVGVLLDEAGDDTYDGLVAQFGGANGGAFEGVGLLVDRGGNDTYTADVGVLGGANGGADLGLGMLLDEGAGDDRYAGRVGVEGGVNGGALQGVGVLVDHGGTNIFVAQAPTRAGGANGAAGGVGSLQPGSDFPVGIPGGLGLLVAGDGDDTYLSDGLTQGAGDLYGLGLLLDAGGHNTYRAGPGGWAQGAGRAFGVGVLLDQGIRADLALGAGTAGQGAGLQGVGLVLRLAEGGRTSYAAAPDATSGTSTGAGVGARVDRGEVEVAGGIELPCTGSPELGRFALSVPLGQPAVDLRVCAPDDATREPLRVPVNGAPVGDLPKAGVPCRTGPLALVDCEGLVGSLLGPSAVDWLERDHFGTTTSGGVTLVYARGPGDAQPALRLRVITATADDICELVCTALKPT